METPSRTDLEAIDNLLPTVFRRLEQKAGQPEEYPATVVQRVVLMMLMLRGKTTMSELSHNLGITKGAATTLIGRMIAMKAVSRSHSETDHRVVHVEITKKGREMIAEHRKRRLQYLRECLNQLGGADIKALVRILEKLADFMKVSIGR